MVLFTKVVWISLKLVRRTYLREKYHDDLAANRALCYYCAVLPYLPSIAFLATQQFYRQLVLRKHWLPKTYFLNAVLVGHPMFDVFDIHFRFNPFLYLRCYRADKLQSYCRRRLSIQGKLRWLWRYDGRRQHVKTLAGSSTSG